MHQAKANALFQHLSRSSKGFTLLEVLIALIVVSIGFLSIAQLQLRSLQYSHASLQRTIAVVQANDLVERMWTGYCDFSVLATETEGIFDDWREFHSAQQAAEGTLPAWEAELDAGNAPLYELNILWQDRREQDQMSFQYFFRLIAPDNPSLSC